MNVNTNVEEISRKSAYRHLKESIGLESLPTLQLYEDT